MEYETLKLHKNIILALEKESKISKYMQDADERDPNYKSYGVRIPQVKAIIKNNKSKIKSLTINQKIDLINLLVTSEYGEQQTIAFYVMEQAIEYYTPDKFNLFNEYILHMFGWSKIDGFAGAILPKVLENYPEELIKVAKSWNSSSNRWQQRASLVLFTRNIAESGKFNDIALEFVWNLRNSKEDLVLKAMGWVIKDVMRSNKTLALELLNKLRQLKVPSIVSQYALKDLGKDERKEILARLK